MVAEAREVVKHLEGLLGGEDEVLVKMDDFFDLPCLNVMWSLVASGRFSLDIFTSHKIIHSIDRRNHPNHHHHHHPGHHRFSYNDPALQKMIRLIDSFTMDPVVGPLVGAGSFSLFLPILTKGTALVKSEFSQLGAAPEILALSRI